MKNTILSASALAIILGILAFDIVFTEAETPQHHRLYSFNNN